MSQKDIVFSGMGMLTSSGVGLKENCDAILSDSQKNSQSEYMLDKFKPVPHLSDKRMLKAVSKVDAFGLVAIEEARKDCKYDDGSHDPHRVGVYVGAAPATVNDCANYFPAIEESKSSDGSISNKEFGVNFAKSRPTTLLVGLPNNVLCYGAIILDAKGPNSNYCNLETSSHIALKKAASYLQHGKLDFAMIGGYSSHGFEPELTYFNDFGYSKKASGQDFKIKPYSSEEEGTILADGSVFLSMEPRDKAEARQAPILATYASSQIVSEANGPGVSAESDESLAYAIKSSIESAQINADDIGIVFGSGYGLEKLDQIELSALEKGLGHKAAALATSSRVWGNLMESGGLGEVGLAHWLYNDQNGSVPDSLQVSGHGYATKINREKPYAMILRSGAHGEYSVLIVKVEVK